GPGARSGPAYGRGGKAAHKFVSQRLPIPTRPRQRAKSAGGPQGRTAEGRRSRPPPPLAESYRFFPERGRREGAVREAGPRRPGAGFFRTEKPKVPRECPREKYSPWA